MINKINPPRLSPLIKINDQSTLSESQVTDEKVYHDRRAILKGMGFIGASGLLSSTASATMLDFFSNQKEQVLFQRQRLSYQQSPIQHDVLTPEDKVISHNNFYEFGAEKQQPAELSQNFRVDPWSLTIDGEVNKPMTLDYDQIYKQFPLEERIYRLRCVEAWSMVIPWIGFSLASLIKQVEPNSKAKYVAFKTLYDPQQMPGQNSRYLGGGIDYPYVEGLRIDEAMNPLTILSVGLYGQSLPPQNGAPIRLVVPWKYGFKSIKSIVSITLTEKMPPTTWNMLAPSEYGFYANVNPRVDHPRWSQATERRITTGSLFSRNRIDTLPFNGYAEHVADMYKGMNLKVFY